MKCFLKNLIKRLCYWIYLGKNIRVFIEFTIDNFFLTSKMDYGLSGWLLPIEEQFLGKMRIRPTQRGRSEAWTQSECEAQMLTHYHTISLIKNHLNHFKIELALLQELHPI